MKFEYILALFIAVILGAWAYNAFTPSNSGS